MTHEQNILTEIETLDILRSNKSVLKDFIDAYSMSSASSQCCKYSKELKDIINHTSNAVENG